MNGQTGALERLKHFLRRFRLSSATGQCARPGAGPRRPGDILIIERAGWDGGLLLAGLQQAGYTAHLVGETDALKRLPTAPPAVLIVGGACDVELYRALRNASAASILALIPQGAEEQVLAAFAAGVDQCQTGYLSNTETVARVRALLRRSL